MCVVVLTGARISAESGLRTFRDKDGLWKNHDPMTLATADAFADDPQTVQEFYNYRRKNLLEAKPNAAHVALAHLEAELDARGDELVLVTQNVDNLHERAGSQRVLHMHGELLKAECLGCHAVVAWHDDLGLSNLCPSCGKRERLRPHIVWFGEIPFFALEVENALAKASLFAAIGTSGSVYPAAGFVSQARSRGIKCCELNLAPSDNAQLFDEKRYGLASQIVPTWVDEVLLRSAADPASVDGSHMMDEAEAFGYDTETPEDMAFMKEAAAENRAMLREMAVGLHHRLAG